MILRSFLIFFSLTLSLYSIDVTVSLGSNGKQSYSLVEVVSEQNFVCEHIEETHLRRDFIKCRFKKIPLSKPVATENSFFKIKPYIKRREFYLEVIPKFNGELYSQTISTLENRTVYKKNIVNSNTWLVLGFDGKNPFFKSRKYDGINFPVKIKEWDYPTIGALDIGGYPIGKGKDYDDFIEYNSLKRLFVKKDFRTLLSRIDRKLEKQEINKLFMPEILAFKIKAMDEQGNRQREVIEIGAPWIVSYTSHKDLPEMMLIVAKAYLDMGIIHEANSILDTLITEYPGNSYAEYAMIFRADRWRKEGKTANAKKYYDKVLYSSDDIEVASLAAYRLARYYIVGENLEKAKELYQKIINSNPKFYLKDYEITLNLAKELVDRKIPYIAAQIGEILSNSIDPTSQYYQKQLLYNARWYRKAGRLKKSLEFFDKFLIDYSYVKNIQDIRKEIDFIKFELDEGTSKERLAFYNAIIQKYP
ncbi:MAG: tetratricopeptide repeat protein, partial [Campylobacterales bacterium]|nr:tetratricopeptide repeat protein [Campylobacterales bacterium]